MAVIGPLGLNFRDAFPTIQAHGTVTTPGAFTGICQLTIPAAGNYEISACMYYGLVGDIANNALLVQNAATVAHPVNQAGVNTSPVWSGPYTITAAAADTVTVQNVAASAAGCVYIAEIIARRVA
jgi:hypothetical protein